jgi:hypothetical protein
LNKYPQYSEHSISRHLGREKFSGCLMAVDNTYFTGFEADLLVVTKNLRVIDVEIKISRQDLKADRHKDKWKSISNTLTVTPDGKRRYESVPRAWPRNVWKHYYCIADPIWQDSLLEFVNPMSGVFTIKIDEGGGYRGITVRKKCKPNKANQPITPEGVVQLGHLANIRMHEAYRMLDEQRRCHSQELAYVLEKGELKAGVARPIFYTEGRWGRYEADEVELTPP